MSELIKINSEKVNKLEFSKFDIKLLLGLSIIGSFFSILFLIITGNMPQIYNDIVVEWTSMAFSNKTSEIWLLRLLIFIGIITIFLFRRKQDKDILPKKIDYSIVLISALIFVVIVEFVLFQQLNYILVIAGFIGCIALFQDREKTIKVILIYFLSYYAIQGIYFIFSLKIINNTESSNAVVMALILSISSIFAKESNLQNRIILLLQLFVPFLFLKLSITKYAYKETLISVDIPLVSKLFIGAVIILFIVSSAVKMVNNWNKENVNISDIIALGTCITIMSFNAFEGSGSIVSTDLHHPFENIIGFQQIFKLGSIPFKEFIPPSGLYSVVHGFVFEIFGKGEFSYYYLASNIFYSIVISLTLLLFCKHVGKSLCLMTSLFLKFPTYNRVFFIAPVILLLLLPKLIKNRKLWIIIFLWVNCFHGLYYPVYGAATMVGFIPMFIYQIINIAKERELKSVKTWIILILALIPIIMSVPLLWGTFVHIKAMSEQTVLADGISVFGQTIPSWFMPYVHSKLNFIYIPIYYILHFVPCAFVIWVVVALIVKLKRNIDFSLFTVLFVLVFTPLISYSFSFIRVDIGTFFARSGSMYFGIFITFIVLFKKFVINNHYKIIIIFSLIFVSVLNGGIGIEYSAGKMSTKYKVPEDFILADKSNIPNLGRCFINNDTYKDLKNLAEKSQKIGDSFSFNELGSFGGWYLFNKRGIGLIESSTIRGFSAAKESRNIFMKNHSSLVSNIHPDLYYLYNWLMCSGEYIWNSDKKSFVYNENKLPFDIIRNINMEAIQNIRRNFHVGTQASEFGQSYKKHLHKNFKLANLNYNVEKYDSNVLLNFENSYYGRDADFIYIKFKNPPMEYKMAMFDMAGLHEKSSNILVKPFLKKWYNNSKYIQILYNCEDGEEISILCDFGKGELLIPLGKGKDYLLSKHTFLNIFMYDKNEIAEIPEIEECQLLKCRTIYDIDDPISTFSTSFFNKNTINNKDIIMTAMGSENECVLNINTDSPYTCIFGTAKNTYSNDSISEIYAKCDDKIEKGLYTQKNEEFNILLSNKFYMADEHRLCDTIDFYFVTENKNIYGPISYKIKEAYTYNYENIMNMFY